MNKIVVASGNKGKLREFGEILSAFQMEVISQKEAGFQGDVEENGTTFAENAMIKAKAVQDALHTPVIADDSGLMIDALDGAPGVYSHRFAGENATDADRMQKVLDLLENVPEEKRTARFVCALCYLDAEGEAHTFEGTCEGIIGRAPKGENGFGYDPIFCVNGVTMAEMSEAEKNAISHRGKALEKLQDFLKSEE